MINKRKLLIFCSKCRILYVEEIVGEVKTLGSVGRGRSLFEDG